MSRDPLTSLLAPEDVCEELKDGQWPDPSDCKSYFLCRGVGSQWGEQKREVCYIGRDSRRLHSMVVHVRCHSGSYFDPNEKTCKWVGVDKVSHAPVLSIVAHLRFLFASAQL